MADTSEMKVWVGCLGCYNAGKLVGRWVEALEAETVTAESLGLVPDIYDLHEELWVFDHEGFGDLLTGECSPMEAQGIATKLDELPSHIDLDAVKAYVGYVGDVDSALADFEEAFQGQWESEAAYAMNLAEETGAVREDLGWPYTAIDWERAARDLFMDGYTYEDGYVFSTYV